MDESPAARIVSRLLPAELQDVETYPVGSPVTDGGLVYATHSGWTGSHTPVLLVIDPAPLPPKPPQPGAPSPTPTAPTIPPPPSSTANPWT